MKKTLLYKALLACWAILVLASCDLDLQKNYDYESSVADPHVKVTAWEFFQNLILYLQPIITQYFI